MVRKFRLFTTFSNYLADPNSNFGPANNNSELLPGRIVRFKLDGLHTMTRMSRACSWWRSVRLVSEAVCGLLRLESIKLMRRSVGRLLAEACSLDESARGVAKEIPSPLRKFSGAREGSGEWRRHAGRVNMLRRASPMLCGSACWFAVVAG